MERETTWLAQVEGEHFNGTRREVQVGKDNLLPLKKKEYGGLRIDQANRQRVWEWKAIAKLKRLLVDDAQLDQAILKKQAHQETFKTDVTMRLRSSAFEIFSDASECRKAGLANAEPDPQCVAVKVAPSVVSIFWLRGSSTY